MTELALDDVERYAFAGELERSQGDVDCVYEGIDLRVFDARARDEPPPPLPPPPPPDLR